MDQEFWEEILKIVSDRNELNDGLAPDQFSDFNSVSSLSTFVTERKPFQVQPAAYLSYAKEALDLNSEGGNLECVTNSKRAVHCQVDVILLNLGFKNMERRNFNQKLTILRDCGILAPNLLKQLNNVRNYLEHDFQKVDRDRAQDFYEIAQLFVEATSSLATEAELEQDQSSNAVVKEHSPFIGIEINAEAGKILVTWHPEQGKKGYYKLVSIKNYQEYCQWIKLIVSAIRHSNLE